MRLILKIKNLVMGILDKQNEKKKQQKQKINNNHLTNLTPTEVKYLLQLISKSEFKGADLQIIFSITAKLQNQLKKTE
jgi:hypothetical protein